MLALVDVHEGDRSPCAPTGDHRKDSHGAVADLAHQPPVLLAAREARELGCLFELTADAGLAAAQRLGDRVRSKERDGRGLGRALELGGRCLLRRRCDGLDDQPFLVEQIDDTHVGELGDHRAREVAHGLGRVERGAERGGGGEHEFQAPALPADAVESEVNEAGGQRREHHADADHRAEGSRHRFVGERGQETQQHGEHRQPEPGAWLKRSRVPDREQVQDREGAARSARRRA